MSAVDLWLFIITSYLLGVGFSFIVFYSRDEDAKRVFSAGTLILTMILLVLFGVKIGGAA
jgi:hypothetical protein